MRREKNRKRRQHESKGRPSRDASKTLVFKRRKGKKGQVRKQAGAVTAMPVSRARTGCRQRG